MAILAPSWPILATTCCQLGPSCVHLGSIFAPTSPKISTRSRQKSQEGSPETPKPPRRSPEGSRTAPGTRIFMVWGSISDLIFHFFLQSLLQFFWRLREWVTSNLRRLFIDLETFSPTSQSSNSSWPPCLKFKARGGLARAAHWIYIRRPREAGGRACVNLGVQLVQYQISNST